MIFISDSLPPEQRAYWVEAATRRNAEVATCDCHGEVHSVGEGACLNTDSPALQRHAAAAARHELVR